jgi:hypothetical protein
MRVLDPCALVEEHLPSAVAVDPERAAVGMDGELAVTGYGGAVGELCYLVSKKRAMEVVHCDRAWRLCFELCDDIGLVKDASGAAEFAKVVGQVVREEIGVAAELWLEELLLKG